jgi:NADH-quinone oxidoreductase subunit H
MRVPRYLAALVVFLTLALTASCARDLGAPQLIEVLDLVPSAVEAGDRVEVLGASFPQGKHAKLTFRGELRRPGDKPEHAEISAEGDATSSTQIEVDFTEGLEQLFCGPGEGAPHTTFTGDVEVSFAAASAGAPPVNATLRAVSLDVRAPSFQRALIDAHAREGDRALAFMGIHLQKTAPAPGGLLVESVAAGSRAEQAGILANDLLTSLDKVRIGSVADVVPAPGHALVVFGLRRGTSATEITREVHIDGYRSAPPPELYAAAIVVGLAVVALVFFLAPTVGLLTWLERRVAIRMQPSRGPVPGLVAWFTALSSGGPETGDRVRSARFPLVIACVALSAILLVMPFGQYAIAADLDVGALYVVALTSLVTLALVSGGASTGRYSPLRGLRSAARVLSYEIPGAIAVACIVMMSGSMRLQEIIRAQGGWPWEWFLFKTPVTCALFFLYFTAVVADGGRAPRGLAEAENEAENEAGRRALPRSRFLLVAESASTFVVCAIAAALFAGGWQLPGLAAGAQEAHPGLQVLGGLVFLLKAWGLVLAALWARAVLPQLRVSQQTAFCWKWLVPTALAALGFSAAWVAWTPGRAAQTAIGAFMFTAFCAGLARFAQRVRHNLRAGPGEVRLNPFL